MNELLIDMNLDDFNNNYKNKILIKKNTLGYDDIINYIINSYKNNPFDINIDIITNIPNIDLKTNDIVWDNLINIENFIFKELFNYFNLLSLDIIKSFIFIYYNDVFDCLKDYINNNYYINIKKYSKREFYLNLIIFTIYFNTNIYNDVYNKIKLYILNNTLIII